MVNGRLADLLELGKDAMLVFWKQNLVLLSVPKTGTTALDHAFAPFADMVINNPPEIKHLPVYRYTRFFEKLFDKACGQKPETIAVMRDPIDWLGSWYRYRQRPEMRGHPNGTHDVSFDAFVLEYIKGKPAPYAAVGSQAKFLAGETAAQGVDHLFRYDNIGGALAFLNSRLGQDVTLEHLNVSPQRSLDLSKGVEKRLRNKCAHEFALYDAIPNRP